MNKIFFFLPLLYRYYTRERKLFFIPFLTTDFFPVALLFFIVVDTITFHHVVVFILSFLAMFTIYEIGYIINDSITIKFEKNPKTRLSVDALDFFEKKQLLIFGIRFSFFLLFCLLIYISGIDSNNFSIFLIFNILLLITYFFHNYFRNDIRFITNTFLNIAKYYIPIVTISYNFPIFKTFFFFLLFPFFRSITYLVEKKTTINIYIFQIEYISLFIACVCILFYKWNLFYLHELVFFLLFFLYKMAVCIFKGI